MTATPWDTKPTAGDHQHLIWDQGGKTIAVVYTDADDAALIVRAVNSHEALRRLFLTAPDPTGFDHTAPGYREAWMEAQQVVEAANE